MTDTTITLRFFARLREELGTDELQLEAEPDLTAGKVLKALASRGGPWAQLDDGQPVMIALNQAMAKPSDSVQAGDELAFFPPVTGG